LIANDEVRRRARVVRQDLGYSPETLVEAEELLSALEKSTGIYRYELMASDPLLGGALAVLQIGEIGAIYQSDEQSDHSNRYNAAHEFGHWFLHNEQAECSQDDLALGRDDCEALPIATVIGYSSRERRESEANIFAAELLLPLPLALYCYSFLRLTAQEIAKKIGISNGLARRQLTDAVLVPISSTLAPPQPSPPAPLDQSQQTAAYSERGPLLLSAGPGTGKTKTLVGRCLFLTRERHVRPESIVALTFSRKATNEMLERLRFAGVGTEQSGPWVGTFHSFGLEILRKYGESIGLTDDFQLIDELDGIALLENHLDDLHLEYLKNVHNPSMYLASVLKRISRAKDELMSPVEMVQRAEALFESAANALEDYLSGTAKKTKKDESPLRKSVIAAQRVREAAHCYGVYEELLRANNLVDYADLIVRAVQLLEKCPDIRSRLNSQYRHVIADEYQDVNRASARMLRLLAGSEAKGLWVVGDHRQSIFQFQGASPANISLFRDEYPSGTLLQLSVNYRSVKEIVDTFALSAEKLSFEKITGETAQWIAARGSAPVGLPAATWTVVNTVSDQYKKIADTVEKLKQQGVGFGNQAILCRTHSQAKEAALCLGRLGIPTLYLGQLLERPEIKDLVAIVAACANLSTAAVARVAEFPEYGLTPKESRVAASYIVGSISGEECDLNAVGSLPNNVIDSVSKLTRHLMHLRAFREQPSVLIQSYLFELSDFLSAVSPPELGEFGEIQSKLAIRQFIDIVEGFDRRAVTPTAPETTNKCELLLNFLRRLAAVHSTSAVPDGDAIGALDAVRIVTIHSAKGLEFPVVYLPNLNEGMFPNDHPPDGIPDIVSPSHADVPVADEEACLFFVALSRARDHLFLYRSRYKDSGRETVPSRFVASLAEAMERGILASADESTKVEQFVPGIADVGANDPTSVLPVYSSAELEQYQRCPRQYFYERIAGLKGTNSDDGYFKYYKVVTQFADWLEEQARKGKLPSDEYRKVKLLELWSEFGPVGHHHEALYRNEAEKAALANVPQYVSEPKSVTLTAKLENAVVQVKPDRVSIENGKIHLTRRVVRGKKDNDHTHARLALFRRAAADTYPNYEPQVSLHYLDSGEVVDVPESARYEPDRVEKYAVAAQGIKDTKFPAKPMSSENCLSCAFLFVCPKDGSDVTEG